MPPSRRPTAARAVHFAGADLGGNPPPPTDLSSAALSTNESELLANIEHRTPEEATAIFEQLAPLISTPPSGRPPTPNPFLTPSDYLDAAQSPYI